MKINKRFTDLFGIDLPIIHAPMAGSSDIERAIAVSEAGGLGSLPCAMLNPEQVDFSPLWSGQAAAMCQEIPAASLTKKLFEESLQLIERLAPN